MCTFGHSYRFIASKYNLYKYIQLFIQNELLLIITNIEFRIQIMNCLIQKKFLS